MNKIRLGYTVTNPFLKNIYKIKTTRTTKLKIVDKYGIEILKDHAKKNVRDLIKIIEWNDKENIQVYRLSCNLIPHINNLRLYDITPKKAFEYKKLDFIRPELELIKNLTSEKNHRLSFHLPIYTKLASPNNEVLSNSIYTIEQYANIIDLICPDNGVMVLHVGGIYNDKERTMKRWSYNYKERLSNKAKKYLALENDEFQYSLNDCLQIHQETRVPIIADVFHHECYRLKKRDKTYLKDLILPVLNSWKGKRAKFHLSEQGTGRIGKHADNIEIIPRPLIDLCHKDVKIDLMLEAKNSLDSLLYLRNKYNCLKLK